MLIRSQSKKYIHNFDKVLCLHVSTTGTANANGCYSRIIIENTDGYVAIAEYESEEIAMFMLDFFSRMYSALNGIDEVFTFVDNETAKELMNDPDTVESIIKSTCIMSKQ